MTSSGSWSTTSSRSSPTEPLSHVEAWGTDHAIFRLGDGLSVRLPKIGWAAQQGEKEARWLPVLEPALPAEVPVPVALGRPANGYPFDWYLAPWIDGENPAPDGPIDLCQLAVDLAEVVRALHRIDTTDGSTPRTSQRGGPLVGADRSTRARAEQLRGETDVDGLLAVWEAGVARRAGSAHRSGSTATCPTATSSRGTVASPASSTGAGSSSATRPSS